MPIAIDSAASGTSTTYGNLYSHSVASGSGNGRVLVVGATTRGYFNTISGATYNGVAMTAGPSRGVTQFGYIVQVQLFYLLDAALPANAGAYTVALAGSGTLWSCAVGSVVIIGAAQQAPEATLAGTVQNSGSSISSTISGVSDGAMVFDAVTLDLSGGTGTATGTNQTERWDRTLSSGSGMGSTAPKTGAGSQTMSWTFNANGNGAGHVLMSFAAPVVPAVGSIELSADF
jgi:hypothetical protein